jgi:hypothetical protein
MDDDSDVDSNPPEPAGDAVGGDALPNAAGVAAGPPAAPQHPVWAAAAAAGRGGAKNRSESIFGPISMLELEIRGRGDLDGASSTASARGGRAKHGKKKRPREYDDDDSEEGDEEEEGGADRDGAGSTASLDMAGAAFGGGGGGPASKKRACRPCASEASDDGASVTSSVVRARHDRAFPVTGVTCVGCTLPGKIGPVTDFISKNMSQMSELALYKMAGLVYKTKVAEPAEEEGVDVPDWDWKEIRAHYKLHSVDSRMQRYENIRTLSALRTTLEMQLLRRDQETGERTVDKNNMESVMKIIAASSRELTLLADPGATKKRP